MMMRSLKLFLVLIAIGLILLFLNSTHNTSDDLKVNKIDQPSISRYKIVDYKKKGSRRKKYILLWESNNKDKNWGDKSRVTFSQGDCTFTHNKHLLNHSHEYDAIVFNPFTKQTGKPWRTLPATRSPHQFYILYGREVGVQTKLEFDEDFYNLTWTYRMNSDIPWRYGIARTVTTRKVIAPALKVDWIQPENNFTNVNYLARAEEKSKLILWIASNCKTPSRREKLVEKLKEFVEVDVMGRCGNRTSSRDIFRVSKFTKPYKFYLSFENSLCPDYVTEKVYKVMTDLIVPIVYNGADINRFLPPNSYIDANAFKTVKDLAMYLKFLANNPQEYIKFFWWKKHYKIFKWYQHDLSVICNKIDEMQSQSETKVYNDIKYWYSGGCSKPKIQF